jgi:hypothetical protein
VLVGRRAVAEGPQREALDGPRPQAVRAPADFLLAVAPHRQVDRHAVPELQHDPWLERRVQAGRHLGHHVGGVGGGPDHLDQERQRGDLAGERRRARVAGVRVAQAGHDVGELDVEGVVVELLELAAEDPQALHRVEAVARALQRQVGVDALQHQLDAVDQPQPLRGGERARRQEGTDQRRRRRGGGSELDPLLGGGDAVICHDGPPLARFLTICRACAIGGARSRGHGRNKPPGARYPSMLDITCLMRV